MITKRLKKGTLTGLIVLLFSSLSAQERERPLNSIHLSLLGDASLLSINYERQGILNQSILLSSKLGIGFNEEFEHCLIGPCPSDKPENYLTIPHHLTANLGKGKHFFEFGLGGTIISGNTNQNYLLYPILGYRLFPLYSQKINFRAYGQIPFTGLDTENILFIPVGLSLGWSF